MSLLRPLTFSRMLHWVGKDDEYLDYLLQCVNAAMHSLLK